MPDTTAPQLDLAEVEARINRHRCNTTHSGDRDYVEVSQILDHDAPALLRLVQQILPALDRLQDAAEELLAELEQRETDALLAGAAEPPDVTPAGAKALRMALLAVPAGLPEVSGEAL